MKKLLLFSVALCATLLAAAAERPPEVVRTGKAEAVNVSVKRRYIGALSSEYDVAIVPRVSGVIEKQNFKDGDFVKKGDLLYLIEDTTYKAAADTAKANVDAAKAKLAQCKAEYTFALGNLKRVKDMHAKKATSDSNLDEATRMEGTAKAALAAAEAALSAAIAAKRDADNNLSYTRIYSPVDGRAGKSVYSAHNYVTPATGVLLTIVSLDPIFVDFSISAKDFYRMFGNFDNMVKNAVITVTTADGTPYHETGTVTFLDNRIDKNTGTIKIRAKLDNKQHKLIPDSLVSVTVERKADAASVGVPTSALIFNPKGSFVYVVGAGNTAVLRPVVPGEIQGNTQVITSGLKVGETIVTEGIHKVIPDKPVIPVPGK